MPKGINYNVEIKGRDNEIINFNNLSMKDIKIKINENFENIYGLPLNISTNQIYNLLKRPLKCSKLFRGLISVTYSPKTPKN
tara:strand:- start:1774 stop:2019 length:246 start_codon:yes stop_codon:yes gene_type:complete